MAERSTAPLPPGERLVILSGLAIIAGLAWLYTWRAAADMSAIDAMAGMTMPARSPWHSSELLGVFIMWMAMMAAMMVPSAAPMVLVYAAIQRQRLARLDRLSIALFVVGYLALWFAFSVTATLAESALATAGIGSSGMGPVDRVLGAAILLLFGIYQFTPLKRVCLTHCRGPLEFIWRHWRDKRTGAFIMGAEHGAYCVGCCWPLMLLLFFAGVMNLLWIALIAVFVLLEKVVPAGEWLGRTGGALALAWGAWLLMS